MSNETHSRPVDVLIAGGGVASTLPNDAAITFHGSSSAEFARGALTITPGGPRTGPGRVVALPLLEGPQFTGVPPDQHGFIAVSEHGEVVAGVIAARVGVAVDPQPLRPVARGAALTGEQTWSFDAELVGAVGIESNVADVGPWAPPMKIVARHSGPYLANGDQDVVPA